MQLFIDASADSTDEQPWLQQLHELFVKIYSANEVCFVSNKPHQQGYSPLPSKWMQAPEASFFDKLKSDNGYKDFVYKLLPKDNSGTWITHRPGHIMQAKIKQLFIVPNIEFLQQPKWHDKKDFSTKMMTHAFSHATYIIVPWDHFKAVLQKEYNIAADKIMVIEPTGSAFAKPLSWDEKEKVKNTYTDGKDYFVFTASEHPRYQLINVLKAFSIFKKWQQSSMQMVIINPSKSNTGEHFSKLNTYKHKQDVRILSLDEKDNATVIAAAYACIHAVTAENISMPVINALYSETPVITTDLPAIKEFAKEAVAYTPADNVDELARLMRLLYKDEATRKEYIEKGKTIMEAYKLQQAYNSEKLQSLFAMPHVS